MGPFMKNPINEHSTPCKEPDNSQRKSEENKEQKISEKGVSVNRNIDHKSKDGDSCIGIKMA